MSNGKRRTHRDLVEELRQEAEAENVNRAALVVGFEESTEFVWSDDPDALKALREMLVKGGEPVAVLVCQGGVWRGRPLAEFEDEEWIEKYVLSLLAEFAREAQAQGISAKLSGYNPLGTGRDPGEA